MPTPEGPEITIGRRSVGTGSDVCSAWGNCGELGLRSGGAVGDEMEIWRRTWCHCVCAIALPERLSLTEESRSSCKTGEKHVGLRTRFMHEG